MKTAFTRRVAQALLVCVAFSALAPFARIAMAAEKGGSWVEVCSSNGSYKLLVSQASGSEENPAPADHVAPKHCAICSLQKTLGCALGPSNAASLRLFTEPPFLPKPVSVDLVRTDRPPVCLPSRAPPSLA